jgi:hypothetical protein
VSRLVRRQPLPPTWEQTSHGFPFLPSFHVIDNSIMEKMQYNTAILHTTIAAKSISSKRGEKYQSSMSSERIATPLPGILS